VNSKGLIEFVNERRWQLANPIADPFNRYRADLLGLRFVITGRPGPECGQQNLERA
jgi:hypothetical protein